MKHLILALGLLLITLPIHAQSASDNFNRANGGLGANWTTFGTDPAPTITNNQIQGNTAAMQQTAFWSANTFGPDQSSTATYTGTTGNDPNAGVGVLVRLTSATTGYRCEWFNGTVYLQKYPGTSTLTTLTTGASSLTNSDTIKMTATGTTLTCLKNGVSVVSTTDSTYTTGAPGINVYGYNGFASLDDWTTASSGVVTYPSVQLVGSGTVTIPRSSIPAGSCSTTTTVPAVGTLTTDKIEVTANANPGVVNSQLNITVWPTIDTVNLATCNSSGSAIVLSGITINWAVIR